MQQEQELTKLQLQDMCALKIQRLWRSYTNRKIFRYYRDIIFFKCKGNPAKLLKGINPLEANLLESSANCHVRFRLGGQSFPPNIYYKIFTRSGVVDIGSFAPRDYASLPRNNVKPGQKIKFQDYKSKKEEYQQQGWYLRNDNNGWRPISHKMFVKSDYVELYSANKVRYYHHKKQKRNEKCVKKTRIARLKWLQNLYKNAKQQQEVELLAKMQKAQEEGNQHFFQEVKNQLLDSQGLKPSLVSSQNPLKNPRLLEIENQQDFQKQVKELIEWSQNLDYENYAKEWFQLSTSEPSSNFVPKYVNASFGMVQMDRPLNSETFATQPK